MALKELTLICTLTKSGDVEHHILKKILDSHHEIMRRIHNQIMAAQFACGVSWWKYTKLMNSFLGDNSAARLGTTDQRQYPPHHLPVPPDRVVVVLLFLFFVRWGFLGFRVFVPEPKKGQRDFSAVTQQKQS